MTTPDGRYRARAIDGDYGKSSKGTPQVVVLFELENGVRRTWYGYLSEKAADYTLDSLRACGVTDLESLAGLGSTEVELVLETEVFDGRENQRVRYVNALGSGAVSVKERMSDAERKAFAASLKGKWLANQPAPVVVQAADPSDDIPF